MWMGRSDPSACEGRHRSCSLPELWVFLLSPHQVKPADVFPKRRVIISQIALQKISNCIFETGNQYEVGGVLLGHRQLRTYFLTDATIPDNQRQKSNHSFELDGAREMHKINELYRAHPSKPMVIGVWHSHVGGVETFSQQDQISNKRFASVAGGIISAIAIPASSKQLKKANFLLRITTRKRVPLCFWNWQQQ